MGLRAACRTLGATLGWVLRPGRCWRAAGAALEAASRSYSRSLRLQLVACVREGWAGATCWGLGQVARAGGSGLRQPLGAEGRKLRAGGQGCELKGVRGQALTVES